MIGINRGARYAKSYKMDTVTGFVCTDTLFLAATKEMVFVFADGLYRYFAGAIFRQPA
jgi:hypothetical protein